MNKRDSTRKSTTLAGDKSPATSAVGQVEEESAPYSLGTARSERAWGWSDAIEFRQLEGKARVATAREVKLYADSTGRWWVRHVATTRVGWHQWKWNFDALNEHGQRLFSVRGHSHERRSMGNSPAEFWGVSKDIAACWSSIDKWVLAGVGSYGFDEE